VMARRKERLCLGLSHVPETSGGVPSRAWACRPTDVDQLGTPPELNCWHRVRVYS
jgi:hypothetical protein